MKLVRFMLIVVLTATTLHAQPREGRNTELSLSGSYQNYSSGSSSGSSGAFLISPRVGFFVFEGLELEPEILLLLSSGSVPVYLLNGNISYNFISAGKGVPFVLLGYGIANTVPIFNVPFLNTDFGVGVLNAGAGVKIFLKENIALRIEYRYQKFSGEGSSGIIGFYSFTQRVDTRIHTVQFGISVLL
jgi:Outer membrane protein beta-barrel domain